MSADNIHDLGAKANDMAREGTRQMSKQMDKTKDAVADAGETLGKKVSSLASAAGDTLKDYGVDAAAIGESARAKTSELQDAILSEIRTNPIRSVAIAAGIGFVLALFARN